MNNTFSFKRFSLLFKKHTIEHAKTYLLCIAVLAGVLFLTLGFFSYSSHGRLSEGVQAIAFVYCMIGAGCIFTSLAFADMGNKRKATGVLTLPASHLEKYLVSWIYTYVIFQVLFVGLFYLIDYTIISISTPPTGEKNVLLNIFGKDRELYIVFVLYALAHAFALWGSIFFEKMHLIKTLFVFFICLILITLLNSPILYLVSGGNITQSPPFSPATFSIGENKWTILPDNSVANFGIVIVFVIIALIWVSTFFRLKEKQI